MSQMADDEFAWAVASQLYLFGRSLVVRCHASCTEYCKSSKMFHLGPANFEVIVSGSFVISVAFEVPVQLYEPQTKKGRVCLPDQADIFPAAKDLQSLRPHAR